jgi:hypothetical protein
VPTPRKLPRRDWVILPLISLLTVVFMFGLSELTTRLVWTSGGTDPCRLPSHGIGNAPNCTARLKRAEGPWVDYSYNDCGYRSEQPCHHKHPGSWRIALLGSSLAEGYMVPYPQTFAAQASAELTKAHLRPVQIQNMGAFGCWPNCAADRVDEALSLKPDAIMLAISPFDVTQDTGDQPLAKPRAEVVKSSFIDRTMQLFSDSRTVLVAKHFLYQNAATYVRLYLMQGDSADFLRQPFTPAWEMRFSNLDSQLGDMAEKIHAAGIPFILIVAPEHAQTVLLGMQNLPPGVDPYAFEKRIAAIAEKHGIVFVDVLKDFRDVAPQVNSLFYPADGHWTAMGHATISQAIVRSCLDGSLATLPGCSVTDPPDPPADRVHY